MSYVEYVEVVGEIKLQLANYECVFNLKPNNIILGVETYKILESSQEWVMVIEYNKTKTVFGIPITIDYDNLNVIKVGYMESTH